MTGTLYWGLIIANAKLFNKTIEYKKEVFSEPTLLILKSNNLIITADFKFYSVLVVVAGQFIQCPPKKCTFIEKILVF
jgi:hypothetical protein